MKTTYLTQQMSTFALISQTKYMYTYFSMFPIHVSWVWHSKADKIVNNFHGQNPFQFHCPNPFQFHCPTLIFMVRTDIFCAQILQSFLVSLHSIPMTRFHAQNLLYSNDKISCYKGIPFQRAKFHAQNLFHSNGKILCSSPIPFQQKKLYSRPATPSCLAAVFFESSCSHWEQLQRQYCTEGLRSPGKLAEHSSKSNRSTCFRHHFRSSSFFTFLFLC